MVPRHCLQRTLSRREMLLFSALPLSAALSSLYADSYAPQAAQLAEFRHVYNRGMEMMAESQFELAGLAFEQAIERAQELNLDGAESYEAWSALSACVKKLDLPLATRICDYEREKASRFNSGESFDEVASDAAWLPSLPDGRALSIVTGSLADCDTGGRVWSSAHVHCRWQAEVADEICGSRVVELGCGTGAVGLYSAALGARRVSLTDGGPPALLQLVDVNIALNRHLCARGVDVTSAALVWGPPSQPDSADSVEGACAEGRAAPSSIDDEPVDWIFGSDVTYWTGGHAALCWTIARLLRNSAATNVSSVRDASSARAVLAHEHRGPSRGESNQDERLERFMEEAIEAGLEVSTLKTEAEGSRRVSILEVALASSTS